jgi:hypothetical protein
MRGEVGTKAHITTKINVEKRYILFSSSILFDIVSRDFRNKIMFCQIHFSEEEERRKNKGREEE